MTKSELIDALAAKGHIKKDSAAFLKSLIIVAHDAIGRGISPARRGPA
ncbi:hypothetical protein [Paenirhodobacter populi]|nr:hypothetical protein [Sinirhodobacter populi]